MLCSKQRREPRGLEYVKDEGVLLHATIFLEPPIRQTSTQAAMRYARTLLQGAAGARLPTR
jgi:hypothetical protein